VVGQEIRVKAADTARNHLKKNPGYSQERGLRETCDTSWIPLKYGEDENLRLQSSNFTRLKIFKISLNAGRNGKL